MITTTIFHPMPGKSTEVLHVLKRIFAQCESVRVELFKTAGEKVKEESKPAVIVKNSLLPGVLMNCMGVLNVGEANPLITGFNCHIKG